MVKLNLFFWTIELEVFAQLKYKVIQKVSPGSFQFKQGCWGSDEDLGLAKGDVLHQLPVLQQHLGALLGVAGREVWPGVLGDHLVAPAVIQVR